MYVMYINIDIYILVVYTCNMLRIYGGEGLWVVEYNGWVLLFLLQQWLFNECPFTIVSCHLYETLLV